MKTAIVYYSTHHGNTKKLAEAIAAKYPVTLIDIVKEQKPDVSGYDCIGLASGIYAFHFAKPMLKFAQEQLPEGKKVFLLSTAAGPKESYEKSMRQCLAQKKDTTFLGAYQCMGFNTFGPTKWFGGTGKGHPTEEEINGAVAFYESLLSK